MAKYLFMKPNLVFRQLTYYYAESLTSPVGWYACVGTGEDVPMHIYTDQSRTESGFELEWQRVNGCKIQRPEPFDGTVKFEKN